MSNEESAGARRKGGGLLDTGDQGGIYKVAFSAVPYYIITYAQKLIARIFIKKCLQ
jgi:hypothetical protein